MELDPLSLDDRRRYGLMISLIQPRPIAWVSTADPEGRRNLAPFSFFTGITAKPLTVCFCPVRTRHGKKKDTLLNVEETKQFVVNLAVESNARQMVATSADVERGVDEFALAGLTPLPSLKVKPPRVKESPAALECELHSIVTISEGALGGTLVIGTVTHIHIDDALWKDGAFTHKDLKPVGRLGGAWYTTTKDDFEIPRPGGGA
ncbi:MAG: flavin reductase family protein [Elusimicrobia bacterium]|nr:flavin reductase family protein [Elusimicrobiota bacterium]